MPGLNGANGGQRSSPAPAIAGRRVPLPNPSTSFPGHRGHGYRQRSHQLSSVGRSPEWIAQLPLPSEAGNSLPLPYRSGFGATRPSTPAGRGEPLLLRLRRRPDPASENRHKSEEETAEL